MRRRVSRSIRLVTRLACTCVIALTVTETCCAADATSCNSELAQMQGDRRDIAARADAVATAIEQFETCARQTADSGKVADSCRRQADDYQKAVTRLNGAVDIADVRVRVIGGSCVQNSTEVRAAEAPRPPRVVQESLPQAAPQPPAGTNASCDLARSYKHKIPFEGVVKICERSMSEAECRLCLGPEEN